MAKEESQTPVPVKPDLSQLPRWVCRVEGNPQDNQWTVGEVFYLECEGPQVDFQTSNLKFQLPEGQEYALQILSVVKQSGNALSLKATTYKAGVHDFKDLPLAEGESSKFVMEPLQLSVKSVIQDPQQKPYGPIMAMKLSYPVWLWFILLAFVLLWAFYGIFRFRRNVQKKKVIEELKQHNTAIGAYNQFNKDLRTLRRKNIFTENWNQEKKQKYIESLDEIFKMYLLREFYVPALDWNSKLILKEISKDDKRRFAGYQDTLKKFLKEMERAKSDVEKVQVHDCKQLTQMALRTTQTVWQKRRV